MNIKLDFFPLKFFRKYSKIEFPSEKQDFKYFWEEAFLQGGLFVGGLIGARPWWREAQMEEAFLEEAFL